jgi:hypothetical protein
LVGAAVRCRQRPAAFQTPSASFRHSNQPPRKGALSAHEPFLAAAAAALTCCAPRPSVETPHSSTLRDHQPDNEAPPRCVDQSPAWSCVLWLLSLFACQYKRARGASSIRGLPLSHVLADLIQQLQRGGIVIVEAQMLDRCTERHGFVCALCKRGEEEEEEE